MTRKHNSLDTLFGETLPERTIAKPAGTWLDAMKKMDPPKDDRWTIECDPGLEGLREELKMKLAPIADNIAAEYLARKADLTNDYIWEDILEDVRHHTGGQLDYKPMDILVGMVAARLGLKDQAWWQEGTG